MRILTSFLPPLPFGLVAAVAVIVDKQTLYEEKAKVEARLVVVTVGLAAEKKPRRKRIYRGMMGC
jgi:hypothetical protein